MHLLQPHPTARRGCRQQQDREKKKAPKCLTAPSDYLSRWKLVWFSVGCDGEYGESSNAKLGSDQRVWNGQQGPEYPTTDLKARELLLVT